MPDLRSAVRRLLVQRPGFTALCVLTLALGIGGTTAVFSAANTILLHPLPWPDAHRVLSLWESSVAKGFQRVPLAPAQFLDLQRDCRSFAALAGWTTTAINLVSDDAPPERHQGAAVTADFFRVVATPPALGQPFAADRFVSGRDDVVILGHGIWQERFAGAPDIVGRSLLINGRTRTVVGVMPPGFQSPAKARFWVPKVFSPFELADRDLKSLPVLGRLADGVSPDQARAEVEARFAALRAQFPDVLGPAGILVHPAAEDVSGPLRPAFLTLLGAVATVLLMAAVNVATLLLARAAARRSEYGIRAALGASRRRIAAECLAESLILALLGGALGLLLAHGFLGVLLAAAPPTLPRADQIRIDLDALLVTTATVALTGLIFGLAPAWQAARTDPAPALGGAGSRTTAAVGPLRRGLVRFQIAAAVVVLVTTGLLLRSLDRVLRQDLGFNPDGVLTARLELPPGRYSAEHRRERFAEDVLARLRDTPGVLSAAATTLVPLQGWPNIIMRLEDRPDIRVGEAPTTGFQGITPDYLPTLGLRLLRGRPLTDADREDTPRVGLVNEAFVREFFSGRDPLGHRIEVGFSDPPRWIEIVGVLNDTKNAALEAQPDKQVYVPLRQQDDFFRGNPALSLVVRVSPGVRPATLAPAVREAVWAVDRDQPLHLLKPLADVVADTTAQRRFTVQVLLAFAAVAVALAAVGVYGVVNATVAARTRELGIRAALGARQADLVRLVLAGGLSLLVPGLALGLAVAALLARTLRALLFATPPIDLPTFAVVALGLTALGFAACLAPARVAARIDPTEALRAE